MRPTTSRPWLVFPSPARSPRAAAAGPAWQVVGGRWSFAAASPESKSSTGIDRIWAGQVHQGAIMETRCQIIIFYKSHPQDSFSPQKRTQQLTKTTTKRTTTCHPCSSQQRNDLLFHVVSTTPRRRPQPLEANSPKPSTVGTRLKSTETSSAPLSCFMDSKTSTASAWPRVLPGEGGLGGMQD